ncbi:MAG: hypothetical protein A2Y36_04880 [Treponema sp. GWA1_62_8]|nr:MAG: hypothetical protein A2Y36_04880 [Treponema sp. GWA1_62_8]
MACDCGFRKKMRDDRRRVPAGRTVYLDYCATTPVDPRTLGAFERACRIDWANPSSPHSRGLAASDLVEEGRKKIADAFGLEASGLLFCSSASEALHAAIWGLAARDKDLGFVTTGVEHASVRAPLRMLRSLGRSVAECPVDGTGAIDGNALAGLLKNAPRSIFVYSPANHETGRIQDAARIFETARGAGALVLMDAAQAAPRLPPSTWAPFADLVAIGSHKLYAPKGCGLLWKRKSLRLARFRRGGTQEGGLFPGTENVPGIAAFAEAAKLLQGSIAEESRMLRVLEKDFLRDLGLKSVPFIEESHEEHAAGVFCLSFPWISDMEAFMLELARLGICVSRFSACSSRVDGPSRVLAAMGVDPIRSSRSMRIGIGRFTVREDLFALSRALRRLAGEPTSP